MPAHINSQSLQQMHQQAQQKSQNNLQTSSSNRSSDQSFAAALRSLAKQQIDVKDEEMVQQGGENKSSSNNPRSSEKDVQASASRGNQYDRPSDMRNLTSPQPPEKKVNLILIFDISVLNFGVSKVARLSSGVNQQSSASIQSELLARSGFQPYRPDERHLHPAGAGYPMDFSPFGPIPGLPSSKFQFEEVLTSS